MNRFDFQDCGGALNLQQDDIQEANGVAFLLLGAAYLTLADAYLRHEGQGGLQLMKAIESDVTESLRRFVIESPHGAARPDIILFAARKVRALLNEANTLP